LSRSSGAGCASKRKQHEIKRFVNRSGEGADFQVEQTHSVLTYSCPVRTCRLTAGGNRIRTAGPTSRVFESSFGRWARAGFGRVEADRPSALRYHPSSRRPRQTNRAVATARGATTHRRMKAPTLMAVVRHRGTEFSNPFPSSGESGANQHLQRRVGCEPASPAGVWCEPAEAMPSGFSKAAGDDRRRGKWPLRSLPPSVCIAFLQGVL
jgi:hypothetical protein